MQALGTSKLDVEKRESYMYLATTILGTSLIPSLGMAVLGCEEDMAIVLKSGDIIDAAMYLYLRSRIVP